MTRTFELWSSTNHTVWIAHPLSTVSSIKHRGQWALNSQKANSITFKNQHQLTELHADVCIWFCFWEFTKDWKNLTSWFHQSFIGLGQDTSHFSRITSKGCRVSKTVHLPCRNKQIGIGDQHVWNAPTLRLKDIGTSTAPLIFQLLIQLSWVYLEL